MFTPASLPDWEAKRTPHQPAVGEQVVACTLRPLTPNLQSLLRAARSTLGRMRIVRRMNRRMNSFRRNFVRASGWTLLLSSVFAIGILTPGCGGDEAPSPTVPGPAPTPPPPSTPEPEAPSPGVPTNLRFSASGGGFIEWRWDAVEGVDGYRVQFSENEAFTEADDIVLRTADQLSYRREGLPPDASAYLRVQSIVRVDGEEVTSEWSQHVQGMAIPPPGVPMNLRISASGRDFIEWSWDAIEGADGYSAQFSEDEAFTEADDIILRTAEQLSYRREGLEPETAAYLRVQSVVRVDEVTVASEWSGDVTGTAAPPPPGILVNPEEFALTEGEMMTMRVRLTTQPIAPVTVAVSVQVHVLLVGEFGKGPPLRIVRGSRLTFDADTWGVERTVTLLAEHDTDTGDEEVSIYLDTTSDDASYESLPRRVIPGAVQDDDPHQLNIVLDGPFLWRYGPQEGVTWNYDVALSGMPAGDVRVEVTSGDPGAIVVTDGGRLFFTPENFLEPQLFRLRGVSGRNYEGATIHIDASGGGYDGVSETLTILQEIAGEGGLIVSDTELSVSEGEVVSFKIRPSTEPVHGTEVWVRSWHPDAVTVVGGKTGFRCSSAWEGCVRPTNLKRLTFTREDWDEPQEVEVEAHQDDDSEDERVVLFLHGYDLRADGARSSIFATNARQTVLVLVNDDDSS